VVADAAAQPPLARVLDRLDRVGDRVDDTRAVLERRRRRRRARQPIVAQRLAFALVAASSTTPSSITTP